MINKMLRIKIKSQSSGASRLRSNRKAPGAKRLQGGFSAAEQPAKPVFPKGKPSGAMSGAKQSERRTHHERSPECLHGGDREVMGPERA